MEFRFDFASKIPLYQQIRDQVVVAILKGELQPSEPLPTIRALSEESGINMMTVSKAYQILNQDGFVVTDRRKGAVVQDAEHVVQIPQVLLNKFQACIKELQSYHCSVEDICALCMHYYQEEETSC